MAHDWYYALKRESNPSQTRSRLRKSFETTLNDLTLIAERLPEDELQKIFVAKTLEPFITGLISPESSFVDAPLIASQNLLDQRRARLSAMMIEICMHFCIRQIQFFMHETPNFKEPIVSRLRECVKISNDLANKIELDELRSKGDKENLVYLFNWSEALGRDKARVDDFILRTLGLHPYGLKHIAKSRDDNSLICRIGMKGFEADRLLEFKIDRTNETGVAILFDENQNETRSVKLRIKEKNKETYVFMKNTVKMK